MPNNATWSLTLLLTVMQVLVFPVFHFEQNSKGLHLDWFGELSVAHADNHQYTCSMHPFVLQDEPGNCPICGMTLVPVRSDLSGPSNSKAISIDPVTQQNMGIRSATVGRRSLHRTIRTVGLVGYEESRQYSVNSKTDGWIERLYVNETGKFVKKGEPLLEIYSPELIAAQEEFLLSLRNSTALKNNTIPDMSASADRLLESSRKRLRYWDISEQQINRLAQSGEVLKTLVLHATYDGIITQKKVVQGMFVKAGMELIQVSDISSVWVYADIYENELPWAKAGQKAKVFLPYLSEPIQGSVSTVYPYVDPKTRTIKVRIDLANNNLELRPDMYVSVYLEAHAVQDVLAIPMEAVINSGNTKRVFLALADGKFEPREVELGLQGDKGFVEIISGLAENDQVVISAQFLLDSESTTREAIQKMWKPKTITPPATQDAQGANADPIKNDSKGSLEELFK